MRALTWQGRYNVQVDTVPDPAIEEPGDIIVKVTSTAICGSDLHLLDGYVMEMEPGDILGHEFMGQVVEMGGGVTRHSLGDRVIVPFVIACGSCFFCERKLTSLCDNTNPDAEKLRRLYGHAPAGLYGYSHLFGGYRGGQAEYVRVPHADFCAMKVPESLADEQVLFLTDIFPTGWMAVENGGIRPGDTVAVWGCGPVGQMAIQSAWIQGAGRVIGIDRVLERLMMASAVCKAETIDFDRADVYETLQEMTGGRGPDVCIDAVGAEAHGLGSVDATLDRVKNAVGLATDRLHALRQAIFCCRKGGTVSVPGVYIGFLDKVPLGAAFNKGLTLKMGQTHVQPLLRPLLQLIESGRIDPSFVITHRLSLEEAPNGYEIFKEKKDGCVKVVMRP